MPHYWMQRCPCRMTVCNGSDPAVRFGVYRNNVVASLINALADTFPVTLALVGDDFFRAMARLYVLAEPPTSKILAFYGQSLPRFIEQFPPAASVPYLADVARLEMQWIKSYHAADAVPLAQSTIEHILAKPTQLAQLRITFQASVGLICSAYAVHSVWAAHHHQTPLESVTSDAAQSVLIVRPALDVELIEISPQTADFVSRLHAGACLGDAFEAVSAKHPHFDLTGAIALIIRSQAIQSFNLLQPLNT
jgi:hypothetical protein